MTNHYLKIYQQNGFRIETGNFPFTGVEGFHKWNKVQNDNLSSFRSHIPKGWELWIHRHRSPTSRYQSWPGTGKMDAVKKHGIDRFIHDAASGHSWVKTTSIQRAFENIKENKAKKFKLENKVTTGWPDISKFSRHQQSIQKTSHGGYLVTGSADKTGYFYLTDKKKKIVKVEAPKLDGYNHLGGCQVVGNILSVGYENLGAGRKGNSKIYFYNISSIDKPVFLNHLTIDRNREGRTAGAVALAQVSGLWILIVANWGAAKLDFYRSNIGDLTDAGANFGDPFDTWNGSKDNPEHHGWQGYQNINLFNGLDPMDETHDLWFVGMHTNNFLSNEDWADLYKLEIKNDVVSITKKRGKHFKRNGKGPRFRNGSGLFYDKDKNSFEIYSCEENLSSDDRFNRCNLWS